MNMFLRHRSRLCLELLETRCLPSTVTNLSDHDPGSLRDAITTTPSGSTVDFQPGLTGTVVLTTGELAIDKDLTIAGPGTNVITVSGNHASRVFSIGNFTVAISELTVADGKVFNADGGGIYNAGTLTITGCTFSGNLAYDAYSHPGNGGGIANYATLTITECTFSGNSTITYALGGGGIYNVGTLTVIGSTFSGNSVNGQYGGGGIWNVGTLTVIGSAFSGNSAPGGGGIGNEGTTTVTGSTFSGNSADYQGGGIFNDRTLTVTGSKFIANSASWGGGISNREGIAAITNSIFRSNNSSESIEGGGGINNGGTLTVTGSTLVGNSAKASGGGIENLGRLSVTDTTCSGNSAAAGAGISNGNADYLEGGTLAVTSSTFSGNSAPGGGGIANRYGNVTMRNTLVASNSGQPGSPDVYGAVISLGHNLIGNGSGGSGYAATDLVGTSASPIDPKLGPLQENGGPTETVALLPGSPAIVAGALTDSEWDQRGPGFARTVSGRTDIGAYEVQAAEGAGDMAQPPDLWLTIPWTRETVSLPASTRTVLSAGSEDARVPLSQTASAVEQLFALSDGSRARKTVLRYGDSRQNMQEKTPEPGQLFWPALMGLAAICGVIE